ncbi:MAG TPA: hypothetical protein VL096_13805 [Pirellulaceae bacterium]|nr:hypothetical protein [Pirellulaceae bacterium]
MKVDATSSGELTDYHWLTSEAARPYFERVARHQGEITRLVTSLRKELSPARAHLVIEQVELRQRARAKFARAEEMYFTRQSFEQATDEQVAAYKAARFSASTLPILDICCGIGGDLLALAAHHHNVVGIDRDPIVAHLARQNSLIILGQGLNVRAIDAADLPNLNAYHAWHVDPDRRAHGSRVTTLENLEPDVDSLLRWQAENPNGAIKLAPATELPSSWTDHAEREWISSRSECRQQMLWLMPRHAGLRTATVVAGQGGSRTVIENPAAELAFASGVGRYLFEPDAAVLAAKLAGTLATEHQLTALADEGGYLTGDAPISDLALTAFAVREVIPFDLRKIKALLRERTIGRLEIKKRGVNETPESLRKLLDPRGPHAATLIIARVSGQKTIAMLADRVASVA